MKSNLHCRFDVRPCRLQHAHSLPTMRLSITFCPLPRDPTRGIPVRIQADNEWTARRIRRAINLTSSPVPAGTARAKSLSDGAISIENFDGCAAGRIDFVEHTLRGSRRTRADCHCHDARLDAVHQSCSIAHLADPPVPWTGGVVAHEA